MSDSGIARARLTPEKVRHLSAGDLGFAGPVSSFGTEVPVVLAVEPAVEPIELLDDDDPVLQTVTDLLQTYGGIIFVGPPGTSKSWYAARVGNTLVDGDLSRLRFVQFHPSYQYEDFIQGFVPLEEGIFMLRDKHFVELCRLAAELRPDEPVVLVIDELSRGDPGRVFGEALTYVERTKRGLSFTLASGTELQVPPNLVILATMNPLDRGVDEVDAALERRFAKIGMDPDDTILVRLLSEAGMADDLRDRVLEFFRGVNARSRANPHTALGHTYFAGISDEDGLRRLWQHQLRFHFDKAYRLDADGLATIYRLWDQVLAVAPPEAGDLSEGGGPDQPEGS